MNISPRPTIFLKREIQMNRISIEEETFCSDLYIFLELVDL